MRGEPREIGPPYSKRHTRDGCLHEDQEEMVGRKLCHTDVSQWWLPVCMFMRIPIVVFRFYANFLMNWEPCILTLFC